MLTKSTLRILWVWLVTALLSACGGPVARVDWDDQGNQTQQAEAPRVLVVTLTGKLGTTELARCHRSIREAESRGCSHVIFRMSDAGSQGEDPGDLQSLYDAVQSTDVPTIAVLRGRNTQGAAGLALVTTQTFLLKGAEWGEVEKPEQEIEVLLDADPEAAARRRLDALRDMMKGRLDRRKNALREDARKLAMAMVDPRVQLITATVREGGLERSRVLDSDELTALQQRAAEAGGPKVFGDQKLTRPLIVDAMLAEEFGLSNGTLQGYDQLADVLAIERDAMGELTVNWAEKMVEWLELLQPFLLAAGFLLLLIEVKTPGTGLPGILGCLFLGLALFYSYLVGLAEITEILVFFLGIAAIAVEIFLLPGTVIFGVVGFLCLMLSLVLSQQSFVLPSNAVEENVLLWNLANLVILFVVVGVLAFLTWRLLPHVPVFNRIMLPPPGDKREPASNSTPSDLGLTYENLVKLVGRVGTAATVLRPTGTMAIDNDRIDVVTEGDFIAQGAAVRVLYVQGNRVVVAADGDVAVGDGAAGDPAAGDPAAGDPAGGDPGDGNASPQQDRSAEDGSVGLVMLLGLVGLLLIFLEVLFVSMGALGIAATGCLLGSIFLAFQESVSFGIGVTVFEAIAAPVVFWSAFKILPKTPFGRHLILTGPPTEGTAGAADHRLDGLVGKSGTALSALRPAGFARIDGRKVDVVTRGEMIASGVDVVVLEVSANRVVVGAAAKATAAP